jgi:hypothetical protein
MSISGVSTTGLPQRWNTASSQSQWQRVLQVRQDFSQLALDLQSGDLAGARKAYADLQTLQASSVAGTSIPTDLAALGQTLATNSLSEALTDSTLLQSDLSSALQDQSGAVAAQGQGVHRQQTGIDQGPTYAATDAALTSTGTALDITA